MQIRGLAQPIPNGPEWERAWARYRDKFPFVGALKAIVARNALYVFRPAWLRLVDNRQGFGYTREWDLETQT